MFKLVKKDQDIIQVASLANTIWHEAYHETLKQEQISYMVLKFQSAPTIKKQIKTGHYYYLIFEAGKEVGYFSYTVTEHVFLSKIYILNEFRKKGYARKVIEKLKEYKLPIKLRVNKENKQALQVYLKLGFSKSKELKTEIGEGFFMDDYVMERDFTFSDLLEIEQEKDYFKNILKQVEKASLTSAIYPEKENWFKALELTELSNVKVVIIGQDPYYKKEQAMGLSFSVNKGIKKPPSLANIYQEIENEYGKPMPNHGDLSGWATQGVLLLNSVLTVSEGKPLSHQSFGWQKFTDEVVKLLQQKDFIVYLLLGGQAQKYKKLITNENHVVLESSHPSPLSSYRGFLGSNIFKQANRYLIENNKAPINWYLL